MCIIWPSQQKYHALWVNDVDLSFQKEKAKSAAQSYIRSTNKDIMKYNNI